MLKNKKILALILLIAIAAGLVFVFFFTRKPAVSPTPSPAPTLFPSPKSLDTKKYESLIYEDPNKNFQIIFISKEKQYQIFINNSPFDTYRTQAENAFLSLLNISKEEACKLKVTIGTPYFVNPNEAGQIYSLSFCPQS